MQKTIKSLRIKTILMGLGLMGMAFSSCTTERGDHPVRTSDRLQLSLPGSSTDKIKSVPKEGSNFYIKLRAASDWKLTVTPEDASSWIELERSKGDGTSSTSISVSVSQNLGASRSAQIIATSAGVRDTLIISQQGTGEVTPTPSPTPSPTGEYILGDATMLEVPALYGGSQNYFITHRAGSIVNYSSSTTPTSVTHASSASPSTTRTQLKRSSVAMPGNGILMYLSVSLRRTSSVGVGTTVVTW